MRCPIHREGFFFTSVLFVVAFIASRISRTLGWFFSFLAAFTMYFFRDPERVIPTGEGLIVSPADGKIIGIDQVDSVPNLNGPAKRVTIFLSIFDVHLNRAPIEGKVIYRQYTPGKFFPANVPKASNDNEKNSIIIEDGNFRVLVRQIAGIIARRILCWSNPGDLLERGERFGLIRFGSRTELFLPLEAQITVQVGQKVRGGETIIGNRS